MEFWTRIADALRAGHAPVTARWVYGGRKYGWSCRLEQGRAGICYLIPDAGSFRVGMALSDTARDSVLVSNLPVEVRETLAVTARAMEGWPVRVTVRTIDDMATAIRLVEMKLSAR